MTPGRALAIATVLWLTPPVPAADPPPSPAEDKPTAALSPADTQAPDRRPYRLARLHIDNPTDRRWDRLRLVPVGGGVELAMQADIAPRTASDWLVPLPATDAVRNYTLHLAGGSVHLPPVPVSISWPEHLLTPNLLIDPRTWSDFEQDYPRWPHALRAGLGGGMALYAALLALAGLTGRPGRAWLASGAVLAGAMGLVAVGLARTAVVVERRFELSPGREVIVLTARRPAVWQDDSVQIAPISPSRSLRPAAGEFTLDPAGGVTVRLEPGQVFVLAHHGRPDDN
jgi:hypothetical protein